ncbi:MAG TPA: hypothetical protein DIT99_28945 [Candidatus Latescibacteria bacterium]|nr:hypothetical protein [Candidatus Latescibacterota bacterium]
MFNTYGVCVGICFILFSLGSAAGQAGRNTAQQPTIRHISIEGNTRTREAIIRRELLFSEGEPLDSMLVVESARNLRRFFFLGQVDIQVQKKDRFADVVVSVLDLYARALSPTLSGKSGELSYGLVGMDFNFLGLGQVVQLTFDHDAITGNRVAALYHLPRLAGTRRTLTTNIGVGAEGHDVRLTVSQPFFSLATTWSYGVSFFSQEEVVRLYSNQIISARYADRIDGGAAWITRSFGDQIKVRPGIRLDLSDRQFATQQGFTYAPNNRRRVLPSVGLTIWKPHFERVRYIQFLGRLEDLPIGSFVSTRVGISHQSLGSDRDFGVFSLHLAPRFKLYANGYTFISLFLSGRRQTGSYRNVFGQAELVTYAQVRRLHTLAFRIRWDAIGRTEDISQLLLGVIRGLRGYVPRRFDGTRRFLLNVEARPTFYRHPAFALGGAFFMDSGTVWTPGVNDPGLNTSVGLGGRLGFTRVYNNPILRADLAYAIQDRTWQLWVGLGQYF